MKVLLHIKPRNDFDVADTKNDIRGVLKEFYEEGVDHPKYKRGNQNGEKWVWVSPEGNAIDFRDGISAYNSTPIVVVEIFAKRVSICRASSPIRYVIDRLEKMTGSDKERWWTIHYNTIQRLRDSAWYELAVKDMPNDLYREIVEGENEV